MWNMRRLITFLMACLMLTAPFQQARASAYDGRPKLVIVLVIDQFRGDYLERYRADFKGRGFRLFLDKGAFFTDCYYDYANTQTAPGHATIGTGAYTDGHGIGSNSWWDLSRNTKRAITSVEDDRYRLVGLSEAAAAANTEPGASPLNLRASTIGDELRLATQGVSHVYGISLKDRSAILPAGAAANAAYWIDPSSGRFITSSYYRPQLPEWAAAFNDGPRAEEARAETGVTGNGKFYDVVGRTPEGNAYELDFVRALIKGEQLGGKKGPTDLLTISLSANDILGHEVGPDSPAAKEMVERLDTDLDSFFTWLDKNVDGGLANVWVTLSADHGVAPIPAEAAKLGMNAATLDFGRFTKALNDAINLKFSPGENVEYLLPKWSLPYLVLNRPAFDRAGINEIEAEQAVQAAIQPAIAEASAPADGGDAKPAARKPSDSKLPPQPIVVRTYTREELAAGQFPMNEFGSILAHSYTPNGGWYVMVVMASYQMESLSTSKTTHFSPWSYDRHVPLALYGLPFTPGTYHGRVGPVDIAATLASLLGVNQPSASVGRILTQAIRPVPPLVVPKANARGAKRHSETEIPAAPAKTPAQSNMPAAPAASEPATAPVSPPAASPSATPNDQGTPSNQVTPPSTETPAPETKPAPENPPESQKNQ
jgi:predicted AlkP superfamily pyrophosphatase or phosphodiesterase